MKYKGQFDKQGLGTGRYVTPRTFAEHRKILTQTERDIETETRVAHIHTFVLQGVWTHCISYVNPFDLSWTHIFYH